MFLRKKIPGKVTFFINDGCNYQCSYCFTSLETKLSNFRVHDCKLFLRKIKKHIPRGWCILISGGGEPFLHPDFFYIVKNLVKSGYLISINTNFSSSINDFFKFLKITSKQLVCIIASLHLEYSNPDIFIDKIMDLKKNFPDFDNYNVVSVALPEKLDYLREIHLKFEKAGIRFELQPLRQSADKYFKYSKNQQKKINQVNSKMKKNKKLKLLLATRGRKCYCGYKYFVLSPYGDSFRCIPAMKDRKNKNGYLGNILEDSFSLNDKPKVCQEKYCYCFEKYKFFN